MIVNETKNDIQTNLRASEHMAGKKSRILLFVAAAFFLVIGGISLALDLVFPDEEGADYFYPILCFVLAIFLGAFALSFGAVIKKVVKKTMQGKEALNRYTFTDVGYEIQTTMNDGTTGTTQGGYGGFTAAKEYDDMWLLYVNKATVFSVVKSGVVEGTAEELSELLKQNLGDRYKVCYKK